MSKDLEFHFTPEEAIQYLVNNETLSLIDLDEILYDADEATVEELSERGLAIAASLVMSGRGVIQRLDDRQIRRLLWACAQDDLSAVKGDLITANLGLWKGKPLSKKELIELSEDVTRLETFQRRLLGTK